MSKISENITARFAGERFKLFYLFLLVFSLYSFFTRMVLTGYSWEHVDHSIMPLVFVFGFGILNDIVTGFYFLIPLVFYFIFIPSGFYKTKANRSIIFFLFFVFLYILGFNVVSEWIFWDEFGVRYNFIAVDYLVYTNEVLGNIFESYPVFSLLSGILIFTTIVFCSLFYLFKKKALIHLIDDKPGFRITRGVPLLIVPLLSFNFFTSPVSFSSNSYELGLSQNGIYQLFSAFLNNELDYETLYLTLDSKKANANLMKIRSSSKTVQNDSENDLHERQIVGKGSPRLPNVVLVMVESLSSEFLGVLGDSRGLTPYIDTIAKEGLLFKNVYATGTRTVRGIESVILSLPPLPGSSIVKRPNSSNLFSLGFLFKERGYENKFIYGGYGYFDNMNGFFASNGFGTVDRGDMAGNEITFSNIWGVSDGDLLTRAIKEFNNSYQKNLPFFGYILTTSNHRPYTYPEGKIDIPSKTGREGAVKYTDYAIGEFFKDARRQKWFDNTVFIIVADHCASSAGEAELSLHNYHIPLIIYGPEWLPKGENSTMISQIDLAPTLLGLLNWSYKSKFFGADIFDKNYYQRAFIGNYQKLGYVRDGYVTILSPKKEATFYQIIEETNLSSHIKQVAPMQNFVEETISYYQSASYLYKNDLYKW